MDISQTLIDWYAQNKRDLPWRSTNDPYKIWLSEVILQQTRVNQGLEYYNRFLERFPHVASLAAAGEEEVLKLWQGLGYYSRARNLHHAAQTVVKEYGGIFPAHYNDLLKLKGTGKYTAAAVASIAGGEAVPVVDGNVSRVISRLFAVNEPIDQSEGARIIHSIAGELIPREDPATFNQAIMEFGALQCKPGLPDCGNCPLRHTCEAFRLGKTGSYPVKKPKSPPRDLFMYYFPLLLEVDGKQYTLLKKRSGKGIWKNLYDFPCLESDHACPAEVIIADNPVKDLLKIHRDIHFRISDEQLHQLTHRTIRARFVEASIPGPADVSNEYVVAGLDELHAFPVPRLIERYFENAGWTK